MPKLYIMYIRYNGRQERYVSFVASSPEEAVKVAEEKVARYHSGAINYIKCLEDPYYGRTR